MKRVIANGVVAVALAAGTGLGVAQAAAAPGLPLEPSAPLTAEAGEVGASGTGSSSNSVELSVPNGSSTLLLELFMGSSGCRAPTMC